MAGGYSTEKLLEMTALHLDAAQGDCNTWKEFASCLLKITQCEEDRMSKCIDEDDNAGGGDEQRHSSHSNVRIPAEILINGASGKSWRFRCRWWLTRHFSRNILASDISSGIYIRHLFHV